MIIYNGYVKVRVSAIGHRHVVATTDNHLTGHHLSPDGGHAPRPAHWIQNPVGRGSTTVIQTHGRHYHPARR